jgi:chromobox protein 1
MPPQITDDEVSEASEVDLPVQIKKETKIEKVESLDENLKVESDKDGESGDEDVAEDEFVVEKITNHLVDEETGEIRYEVKWEGWEKKSDRTWEPEENLETAAEILTEYLAKIGGKEAILQAFEDKKSGKSSKKRGRASTGAAAAENGSKRGRKSNGAHPASATPPKSAEFKPPTGNWEDEVVQIDACEGAEGTVVVYLTWKGGQKSQHPLAQVYKRCPQKMLKFYESHLVFKKTDDGEAV